MSIGRMGATFLRFPRERRENILDICIDLFYRNGYGETSTIGLKNALGVAKGTFYKYVVSKEDLFLYIMERILQETLEFSMTPALIESTDILERFRILDERMRRYYLTYPQRFILLMRTISNPQSHFFDVVEKRRIELTAEYLSDLLDGVDWDRYQYPKADVINLVTWATYGHRHEIYKRFCRGDDPEEIAATSEREFAVLLEMIGKAVVRVAG